MDSLALRATLIHFGAFPDHASDINRLILSHLRNVRADFFVLKQALKLGGSPECRALVVVRRVAPYGDASAFSVIFRR